MFSLTLGLGRGRGRGATKLPLELCDSVLDGSGLGGVEAKMHHKVTPISQPGFSIQPRKIEYNPEIWNSISEIPELDVKTPINSKWSRYFHKEEVKPDYMIKMLPHRFVFGAPEDVRIAAKPPPEVYDGISLDEIPSPELTPAEKLLNDFEQELLVIYKKCVIADRFDIIPPIFFSSWYTLDEELSSVSVSRMMSGEGPHKFYLMGRRNVYIDTITQNWLKSLVDKEKIEEIESDELEELKGGWVAAVEEDGTWRRAKVIQVYCGDSVSVMYPDRGDSCHALPVCRLRHLPGNLWDHQGLCFRAALAGISKDDAEWDSNEVINKGFIEQLEILGFINSEIVRVDENDIVEVNLWEIGCTGMTINERMQKSISEWSHNITYGLTPEDIQKVTIKENTDVLYENIKVWQIVKVITPSYFTVRIAHGIDTWKEKLQTFYNGLAHGRLTIRQGRVEPLQCYAYYVSENSSWNRVQIIAADNIKKSCQIYFWDLGIYKTTEFDNLRKLIPQFCSQPPEAYRCYLVHILSDKTNSSGQPIWSQKTLNEFAKMAPENVIMTGIVVTTDPPIEIINVGPRLNLGVILLDHTDDTTKIPMNISLQHKLCELNLATANGIAAGGWNMVEKFQKYVISSPEISPVFMSQSSPLLWKKTYDYYTKWTDPKDHRKFMPTEIRKNLCWIKITKARSPTCLFVQIQEQIPAMMFMMSRLAHYVKDERPLEESTIKPGVFAAVYCRITGEADDKLCYRAIVTEVRTLKNIKVFLIDFAIPYVATAENIRSLPKKFLSQPSYAHRIHLDCPLVPKFGTMYGQDCCDFFRKYVKIWNFACPIYYMWQRKESQVIQLEGIYQDLQYDSCKGIFEKSEQKTEDIQLAHMKESSLLSHLFVSIGVTIEYEEFNPIDQPYTFKALHNVLVDKKYADT